jgi:hypothetical protein
MDKSAELEPSSILLNADNAFLKTSVGKTITWKTFFFQEAQKIK